MLPDVVVVSRTLEPVSPEAVGDLEVRLGNDMPAGYTELVGSYGGGTFCNEFNLLPPDQILARLEQSRETWAQYWFRDEDVVTQAESCTST
jgi:hypothetical protein